MSNRSVFSHSRPSPTCPPSGCHPIRSARIALHATTPARLFFAPGVSCLGHSALTLSCHKPFTGRRADGDKPQLWCSNYYQLWLIYLHHRIIFWSFPLHVFSSRKAPSPSGQGQFHYVPELSAARHLSQLESSPGYTWEAARLSYMTLQKIGATIATAQLEL